ncbi:MAG TPA: UDP-N-acetylmuramoyl-L-alanyl-D-glutamate--2,6-diaminopimelate ligase [Gammaproteobacteria bacterium]|nr:UDP-N-acetylmuramoyl-L-alanyl-D-glutamate--2,6-diaminopimelate ligase [Gammaproteobacteria bacterium]
MDHLLDGLVADAAGLSGIRVRGLASDSRSLCPGDLFLAVAGLQGHGLDFLDQALARGAVAVAWEPAAGRSVGSLPVPAIAVEGLGQRLGVVADRFYGHPSQDLFCIGVTGTDGKTSVTHFIATALADAGRPCGLLGTLGYGLPGQLHAPTHTTPDALRLQAELAALRDKGAAAVAMEASSHALHQGRCNAIAFDVAVLTNLSRDHLDYHGTQQAYADAKRRLFRAPGLSTWVLNADDAFGRELAAAPPAGVQVIRYALETGFDRRAGRGEWLHATRVETLPRGLRVTLETSAWGEAVLETRLLGGFNAANLLAALGALLAAGVGFDTAIRSLARVETVAGRMEAFGGRGRPLVVVDYAHTPNALDNALRALRAHCRGELICVFGAGGDRDRGKRPQMGAVAEAGADRVILTSDNPRSEDPQRIIEEIAAGAREPARLQRIVDRAEAIDAAIAVAGPDDLVLVAGKGHEDYQQIGVRRLAFSDRARVQRALRRLGP